MIQFWSPNPLVFNDKLIINFDFSIIPGLQIIKTGIFISECKTIPLLILNKTLFNKLLIIHNPFLQNGEIIIYLENKTNSEYLLNQHLVEIIILEKHELTRS